MPKCSLSTAVMSVVHRGEQKFTPGRQQNVDSWTLGSALHMTGQGVNLVLAPQPSVPGFSVTATSVHGSKNLAAWGKCPFPTQHRAAAVRLNPHPAVQGGDFRDPYFCHRCVWFQPASLTWRASQAGLAGPGAPLSPPLGTCLVPDASRPVPSALRDSSRRSINSDWKIALPGEFQMAGTTVRYVRRGLWEKISANGPTEQPLHLMVGDQPFPEISPGGIAWSLGSSKEGMPGS